MEWDEWAIYTVGRGSRIKVKEAIDPTSVFIYSSADV